MTVLIMERGIRTDSKYNLSLLTQTNEETQLLYHSKMINKLETIIRKTPRHRRNEKKETWGSETINRQTLGHGRNVKQAIVINDNQVNSLPCT